MTTRTLRISPRAQKQIHNAARWWQDNRSKAPSAFADDLQAALNLIRERPTVGVSTKSKRVAGARQLVMKRVRYTLYYRFDEEAVDLLALWHTSRGTKPPL